MHGAKEQAMYKYKNDKEKEMMEEILKYPAPGFYLDERGAYGVVIGAVYICCFVDDGEYDVTADTIDENGDFALNLEWESFKDPSDVLASLRQMAKKYVLKYK